MTTTYSPTTADLTEFVGTSGLTVTATPDAASSIYIGSVTVSETPSDLVVSNTSTSFTFASTFADRFDRIIKYVKQDANRNKTFGSVSRFSDLPADYVGMYQYVPPSVEFKNVTVTINMWSYTGAVNPLDPMAPIDPTPPWGAGSPVGNPLYDSYKTTETWTFVLRQNWQSSIIALQTAVHAGSSYQAALAKYPEMSL